MFHSWDIQFFYISIHLLTLKSCDITASISTYSRNYFWIYLLSLKSFGHKTWPTNRYNHGQCIRKYFRWFSSHSPKSGPFLIYQPIIINKEPVMSSLKSFNSVEGVHKHSQKTSKFEWTLNNIRIGKIISAPVLPKKIFLVVSAVLAAILGNIRKNNGNLRKWQKPYDNFITNLGPPKFFQGFI